MDAKKTEPESEFSFIQEKVVPRRKNKVKKAVLCVVSTLALAIVFGFVARIVFIKSEGLVNFLLGIDTTERSEILFPSQGPEDDNQVAGPVITPEITETVTPEATPEVTAEPTKEPEEETTVVEQKIDASIADYEKILLEIRKVANAANNSLVAVMATESKEDRFNQTYESSNSLTGIVIGENNAELLILTTYDKVQNATNLKVGFAQGTEFEAKLWDYDVDCNLAVLAVELKDIPKTQMSAITFAELGESYSVTLGSAVVALGHPNGNSGSMMLGIVSGKGDMYYITDNRLDIFTTDITNTESTDGVIINLQGEIIGIITQKFKDDYNDCVNTVVGISRLRSVIKSLVNREDRIYFGITAEDIPPAVLTEYGIANGVYITKVVQDSPSFAAGIKQGDIITGINEYTVSSVTNYVSILTNYKVGDTVNVIVQRKTKGEFKEIVIPVTLEKK